MIEPRYVITKKTAVVAARFMCFYRVVRGCRKVCEVWVESGRLRKSYDIKGKLIRDMGGAPQTSFNGPRFSIVYAILRDTFDWKAALKWASRIEDQIVVPAGPMGCAVYTKSDLFGMVLEAQQAEQQASAQWNQRTKA